MNNLPAKLNLNLLSKKLCEDSFYTFIKTAWPLVDSAVFDESAWHLKLLADYFQALREDKVSTNNLLINIPPRFGKSRVADLFSAWVWTTSPKTKFIYASYGAELAEDASKMARTVICSAWYQRNWPIKLIENKQNYIKNNNNGSVYSVGCGGAITGKSANYLIADDILKANESYSDTEREKANSWYNDTFSNRFDNIKTLKKVVIGQRLHSNDVTGMLLDKSPNSWEQIILPLEYEGKRYVSSIGLDDPRTVIGESLWPNRFGAIEIEKIKNSHSELGYACQFCQRASTVQGNIFRKDWFSSRVDSADIVARYISVDPALSEKKSADNSSILVGEINSKYQIFVRHVFAGRLNFPDLQVELENIATRYKKSLCGIIIESKGSGISLQQSIKQSSPEWMKSLIIPFNPTNQKEDRFMQVTIWCEKGMILLPPPSENYPWLFDFEAELFNVPQSRHDDMADALTQLILYCENYLAEGLKAKQEGGVKWD